jgi:hypothetical protein
LERVLSLGYTVKEAAGCKVNYASTNRLHQLAGLMGTVAECKTSAASLFLKVILDLGKTQKLIIKLAQHMNGNVSSYRIWRVHEMTGYAILYRDFSMRRKEGIIVLYNAIIEKLEWLLSILRRAFPFSTCFQIIHGFHWFVVTLIVKAPYAV